jgi:hypothetical protein
VGEILPSFALSSAFTVSITNGPLLPCSFKARNYFNYSPHKRHYTTASRILNCISCTHKSSILQCEVIRLHTPERYRHTLIWKNYWTAQDTQWSVWIGGIVRTLLTVGVMSKSGLTKSSISLPRSFLHQWTIVRMTKVYFQPHFKTGETMSASEAHHTTKRSLEYMNSWSEPSDLAKLRLGASQGKTSNNKYFWEDWT